MRLKQSQHAKRMAKETQQAETKPTYQKNGKKANSLKTRKQTKARQQAKENRINKKKQAQFKPDIYFLEMISNNLNFYIFLSYLRRYF